MIFTNFDNIADDVKQKFPPVLYKYRHWGDNYHQKTLSEPSIWLSAPSKLNDKYDVRIPVTFDPQEVDHPLFLEKLKAHFSNDNPLLDPNSRDIQVIAENHLDRIRENPIKWFGDVYKNLRDNGTFEHFGVFSLTEDPTNQVMWAHYGKEYEGFCVGYETIALLRPLNLSFGPVIYRQEPYKWSFIEDRGDDMTRYYIKGVKWEYEKEWRVMTIGVTNDNERAIKINPPAISEVILGTYISKQDEKAIISVLKDKYSSQVRLYKVLQGVSGLERTEIAY